MLERREHMRAVQDKLRRAPVVAILGARQIGKTTLARDVAHGRTDDVAWFDLENIEDRARLADPLRTLKPLPC